MSKFQPQEEPFGTADYLLLKYFTDLKRDKAQRDALGITLSSLNHVTNDEIYKYLSNKLGTDARESFEDHTSLCVDCVDRLSSAHSEMKSSKSAWDRIRTILTAGVRTCLVAGLLQPELADVQNLDFAINKTDPSGFDWDTGISWTVRSAEKGQQELDLGTANTDLFGEVVQVIVEDSNGGSPYETYVALKQFNLQYANAKIRLIREAEVSETQPPRFRLFSLSELSPSSLELLHISHERALDYDRDLAATWHDWFHKSEQTTAEPAAKETGRE